MEIEKKIIDLLRRHQKPNDGIEWTVFAIAARINRGTIQVRHELDRLVDTGLLKRFIMGGKYQWFLSENYKEGK